MKRILCGLVSCGLAVAAVGQSSPYQGVDPDCLIEGDYYLYNVGSGLWLGDNCSNTQRYTSRAELGERGIDVALRRSGEGWQLDPKLGHNHSINAGNLYMDTNDALTVWRIAPAAGDVANGVTITSGDYSLGASADGLIVNDASDRNVWQLVTRSERLAVDTRGASADAPADLSWAIYGATFPIADERRAKWQGAWDDNSVSGDELYHCNRVWEMWGVRSMEITQELTGLPDGTYAVSAQAVYSHTPQSGLSEQNYQSFALGHYPPKGYVFANDSHATMTNIYTLASTESKDKYNTLQLADDLYMPDGVQQIANHMFEGAGLTEQAVATVTDGRLRLGVGVAGGEGKAWIIFDNFRLSYLGNDTPVPDDEESATISSVEYREGDRAHLCISFEGTEDLAFDHGVAANVTVTDADGDVVAYGTGATNCYDNEWHHTAVRLTLSRALAPGYYSVNIPANSLLLSELKFAPYHRALTFGFDSSTVVAGDGDNEEPKEQLSDHQTYADGVRIAWHHNSQRYIGPGSYGRVIRLADGTYVMVYSTGGSNIGGQNFIRWQTEPYGEWSDAVVSRDRNSFHTNKNAEIYQLKDGRLMYAWLYRTNYDNSRGPSKIMAAYSSDGGHTWENEQEIYVGTDNPGFGVWEPAMLQLPDGELQLYFANEASARGSTQNISMRRSYNGGRSWEPGTEIVSYRANSRDGMPVPVYLKNRKGIAVAIEDPGFQGGTFKPMIVHTDADDNWASGAVDGGSAHRWPIFGSSSQYLPGGVYCGQPYLIQLHTGETVYSAASGEGRDPQNSDNHGRMAVYVGDSNAKNFIARSFPFPFVNNANARAIWNSIMQYNDSTLLSVCTVEGSVSKTGIWTCEGTILRPIASLQAAGVPDWKGCREIFIGAESQAEARIRSMWDDDCLYYRIMVKDDCVSIAENADGTDGVELYLGPTLPRLSNKDGLRRYRIGTDGSLTLQRGSRTRWTSAEPDGTTAAVSRTADGYTVTVAIPWEAFGGKPSASEMYTCYMLHNVDTDQTVHETLSGSDADVTGTWMRMPLTDNPGAGIDAIPADDPASAADTREYNLLGQPAGPDARGVIISGGRKILRR